MPNNKLDQFEAQLNALLHAADLFLEEQHGQVYRRHPARPANGQTANPQYDGLFTVTANFSIGVGSLYGAGYTIVLRVATLEKVSEENQQSWESELIAFLRDSLPNYFPERELCIDLDKQGWKLHGDLSIT